MAVNYGQVAIVPKGVWNAETQYKVNNLVEYDGSSYVAKVQPPVGTLPTDTSYWQVSAAGTKKATADSLGTVMPDGITTEIKEDGKLSAKTAQQNALGVVKGSDDVTVGEDGNLTVNTTFEQATELANIIAGEAIKSVLGKVSKAIATTMSLDENALLKNMISGIDVNDSNKVPSSAYIHTLVERIGIGTELVSGLGDLTTGLNTVSNNLSMCLQYIHSETDVFDFNDPKTPAGYHRLGAAASYKNAPSGLDGVNFCTVEVVRPTISDTLAMTIYPYKKGINPPVWYKSGGSNEWSTLPWNVYATKSDLSNMTKKDSSKFMPGDTVLDVSAWSAITLLSIVTYKDEATALYLIRKESSNKIYCIPVKSSTQVSVTHNGENKLTLSNSATYGGTWAVLFLS